MSNVVINSNTYQNIDYIRVQTEDESVAQAPIIAETPSGVTLLKYLDTTGTGCVDIGMKLTYPSTGFSFFMDFGILDATSTQIVFTSNTVTSPANDQLVLVSGRIRFDRVANNTLRFNVNLNDKIHYCESFSNATNASGYLFGENETTHASYAERSLQGMHDLVPNSNMILFAELHNGTPQTFATVRFYELCYKEGNTEIIHLYPAVDANGVKCLYDSVSETCIYSSDGAFASE